MAAILERRNGKTLAAGADAFWILRRTWPCLEEECRRRETYFDFGRDCCILQRCDHDFTRIKVLENRGQENIGDDHAVFWEPFEDGIIGLSGWRLKKKRQKKEALGGPSTGSRFSNS